MLMALVTTKGAYPCPHRLLTGKVTNLKRELTTTIPLHVVFVDSRELGIITDRCQHHRVGEHIKCIFQLCQQLGKVYPVIGHNTLSQYNYLYLPPSTYTTKNTHSSPAK